MGSVLVRGLSFTGITIRNILLFAFFITVILFLFFIPEILKFNWSEYFGLNFKSRALEQVRELANPLEEVLQGIRTSEYANVRSKADNLSVSARPAVQSAVKGQGAEIVFNPQAKITKLEIIKIDNYQNKKKYVPPATYLNLSGIIKGKDVRSMDLYKNGQYDGKISFSKPDKNGDTIFVISEKDAYGYFTIHIEDKNKNIYEKTYRFFPKIEKFSRDRGAYKLRYAKAGLDPSLESLFTAHEVVPGRQFGRGFIEF